MRLLNSHEQIDRNRRKFFMKYGFDIIKYTDLTMSGSTDDELILQMEVSPKQLEDFRKDVQTKKLKQWH